MSSVSKKRKLADEKKVFQVKWEDLYFVTEVSDEIQCLVCQQTIAVPKEYNVRRHYGMHREKYDVGTTECTVRNMTSALRNNAP